MTKKIIIGTRGSKLALWQSEWVKKKLLEFYPKIKISLQIIKTKGDKILDTPLAKLVVKVYLLKK